MVPAHVAHLNISPKTELYDLVRDLNLPKDAAERLGARLKDKNMLTPGHICNIL
jgi:hypothetical protein